MRKIFISTLLVFFLFALFFFYVNRVSAEVKSCAVTASYVSGANFELAINSSVSGQGTNASVEVIRKASDGSTAPILKTPASSYSPGQIFPLSINEDPQAGATYIFQVHIQKITGAGRSVSFETADCSTTFDAPSTGQSGDGAGTSATGSKGEEGFQIKIKPLKTTWTCTENCSGQGTAKGDLRETDYPGDPYDEKHFNEDSTRRVYVNITGIRGKIPRTDEGRKNFFFCLKAGGCKTSNDYIELSNSSLKDPDIFKSDDSIEMYACPSGEKDLKIQGDCKKELFEFSFKGGNNYKIGIYEKYKNSYILLKEESFSINHAYPYVYLNGVLVGDGKFDSQQTVPTAVVAPPYELSLNSITLKVKLAGRRPGDKDGEGTNNNYEVILEEVTGGYKTQSCTSILNYDLGQNAINKPDLTFFREGVNRNGTGLPYGDYVLTINEQVNEKRHCEGGFTYWRIFLTVMKQRNETTKKDEIKMIFTRAEKDPNGIDIQGEEELGRREPGGYRCITKGGNNPDSEDCVAIKTSIGTLSTNPADLVKDIFSIILSIAGVGAAFMLVYAGYLLMMSAGDKQKLQNAREIFVSVILGLLFIIFSFVILEFIGVDILNLPGLNR